MSRRRDREWATSAAMLDLQAALSAGDLQTVQALIAAGADIRYKREHGYDALIDAVHGRDVFRDRRLLDLLRLLIAHGVDVSGVSSYGESAVRVLSRSGRFDAVELLLEAGCDRRQLGWTPLMGAVATGSLVWVKSLLDEGAELEDRDWWSRTAWLIAVQTGDIAKAELIREYGANVESRGRCGRPAAFYAIMCHSPEMLRWLIEEGIDIRATDEFGTTALIEAVESDDLACAGILLEAGCDVDADANGTALSRVNSRDMALQLLDAGADPGDMTCEGRRLVLGLSDSADEVLGSLSAEAFHSAHTRRFGFENPERMHVPFWEAMVKCGASAYEPRERFDAAFDSVCEPVWCAQRFGQSLTLLPDGRAILIGGEHEDYYDPDFCIYNDVIVFEKSGAFAIYGYPESVFPPTDFHTATLVGDFIYVIGSLGYQDARQYGTTPVYRLDVRTLRIDCVHCDGPTPGWIHRHRAACAGSHEIRVWGGTTSNEAKHGESVDGSRDSYVLDLRACRWRRE